MTTGDWVIVVVVLLAAAAIIAHSEWRYRQLREWLDAIGEMVGEWIDSERTDE